MGLLEYRILAKRQELQDVLTFALRQSPVLLTVVRDLKREIYTCDLVLKHLYLKRIMVRSG